MRDLNLLWIYEGVGETQPLFRGLGLLAVGGGLAFWSRSLAKWAITTVPDGCPRCGYPKVEQDVCPECGLRGFRNP